MRVHTSAFAAAALSAALLTSACNKQPAPPPGSAPAGTQPNSAAAPQPAPATTPATTPAPVTTPAVAPAPSAVTAPATAAAPAPVTGAPAAVVPATPVVTSITVPAGTRVTIRTNQSLSGEHNDIGTPFSGELNVPVVVRGATVFRRGTEVRGEITTAKSRGRFKGRGYLGISLLSIGGYRVTTSEYLASEKGRGKRTGTFIGGGAGVGALIGGLAGGGKGALIGGLSGAGAGTAAGALTGSRDVVIPAESAVSFTTQSSITVKR